MNLTPHAAASTAPSPGATVMRRPARPGMWAVGGYGLLGLPLAFAALPIYVHLPKLYGESVGIPLAVLGVVLLVARLADAFVDPWLGALSDQPGARRTLMALALGPFAAGLAALFNPPPGAGVLWLSVSLAVTYLSFSLLYAVSKLQQTGI